jgi:hypothetical protein
MEAISDLFDSGFLSFGFLSLFSKDWYLFLSVFLVVVVLVLL